MAESNQRVVRIMCILSAIFLLATGGIHLFLVFNGTGGVLGVAFILNAIAGVVLVARSGRDALEHQLPLGPFLALGAFLVLAAG